MAQHRPLAVRCVTAAAKMLDGYTTRHDVWCGSQLMANYYPLSEVTFPLRGQKTVIFLPLKDRRFSSSSVHEIKIPNRIGNELNQNGFYWWKKLAAHTNGKNY